MFRLKETKLGQRDHGQNRSESSGATVCGRAQIASVLELVLGFSTVVASFLGAVIALVLVDTWHLPTLLFGFSLTVALSLWLDRERLLLFRQYIEWNDSSIRLHDGQQVLWELKWSMYTGMRVVGRTVCLGSADQGSLEAHLPTSNAKHLLRELYLRQAGETELWKPYYVQPFKGGNRLLLQVMGLFAAMQAAVRVAFEFSVVAGAVALLLCLLTAYLLLRRAASSKRSQPVPPAEDRIVKASLTDDIRINDWAPGQATYSYADPTGFKRRLRKEHAILVSGMVLFSVLLLISVLLRPGPVTTWVFAILSLLLLLLPLKSVLILRKLSESAEDEIQTGMGGFLISRNGSCQIASLTSGPKKNHGLLFSCSSLATFDAGGEQRLYDPDQMQRSNEGFLLSSALFVENAAPLLHGEALVSSSDDGDVAGADTAAR